MSYSLEASVPKESAAFAATRPQVVRETARRLSGLGIDVLKLEFPIDAAFNPDHAQWKAECEAISAVCQVPWVLLSAGVDFETFEQQTRVACEAGASGWLAGRAIWKESVAMTREQRRDFLAGPAIERAERLAEIASRTARSWTDFYTTAPVPEGWFKAYDSISGA
jgi:tagatose 1,6-diphosphate aldolase